VGWERGVYGLRRVKGKRVGSRSRKERTSDSRSCLFLWPSAPTGLTNESQGSEAHRARTSFAL
jgi:hypothetical protein